MHTLTVEMVSMMCIRIYIKYCEKLHKNNTDKYLKIVDELVVG